MNRDAAVRNASDKEQVKEASRKQRDKRKIEIQDLQVLLELDAGKRFIVRLLRKCRTMSSIWEGSARIHYNSGQQDLGQYFMREIAEIDEVALAEILTEVLREGLYG